MSSACLVWQAEIIRHLPVLVFGRRRKDSLATGEIALALFSEPLMLFASWCVVL